MRRELKFKLNIKQRVTTTMAVCKPLQKLEETPVGLILSLTGRQPFPGLPGPIPEASFLSLFVMGLHEALLKSPPSH